MNEYPVSRSAAGVSENPVPSVVPLPPQSEDSENELSNKNVKIFEATDISDDAFFNDANENYEDSRDTDAATVSVSFEQPHAGNKYSNKSVKKALRYRRLKGGKLEVREERNVR